MKIRLCIAVVLLTLLIASSCTAQVEGVFAYNRSYSASVDTSDTVRVPAGDLSLAFYASDSCNVAIAIDYKFTDATVWATYNVEADSTNSTAASGLFKGYILRRGTTNNLPGATMARIRITKRSTKNGVTTPNYYAWLTRN